MSTHFLIVYIKSSQLVQLIMFSRVVIMDMSLNPAYTGFRDSLAQKKLIVRIVTIIENIRRVYLTRVYELKFNFPTHTMDRFM